jgi:hypothetical protein
MTMTQTSATTSPDAGDLTARVRELQPLLAKNSAQGKKDRRVLEESIQALTGAGIFMSGPPRSADRVQVGRQQGRPHATVNS